MWSAFRSAETWSRSNKLAAVVAVTWANLSECSGSLTSFTYVRVPVSFFDHNKTIQTALLLFMFKRG